MVDTFTSESLTPLAQPEGTGGRPGRVDFESEPFAAVAVVSSGDSEELGAREVSENAAGAYGPGPFSTGSGAGRGW